MNARVKKFIEENVDLLTSNMLTSFLTNWYFYSRDPYTDATEFEELIDVLIKIGYIESIDSIKQTRKRVIQAAMSQAAKQIVNNARSNKVHFADLAMELNSHFDFNTNELSAIIVELFTQKGYTVDIENQVVYL